MTLHPLDKLQKVPGDVERRILGSTRRWVIQGGVFVVFTAIIPCYAISPVLKKRFPKLVAAKIIMVITDEGSRSYWIYDEDEFIRLGMWCLTHPRYINTVYRAWKKDAKEYYDVVSTLEHQGFTNLTRDYQKFYSVYVREYSTPLITEYFSLGGDALIRKLIEMHGNSGRFEADIVTFTQPPKLSFLQRADVAVIRAALQLKGKRLPAKFSEFTRRYPHEARLIEDIQRKFFWIYFNYRETNPLSQVYFYGRVRSLARSQPVAVLRKRYRELARYETGVRSRQGKAARATQLTRDEIRKLKAIGFAAHWQDERKEANLKGNYLCNSFLAAAANSTGYQVGDLRFTTSAEFTRLLRGVHISKKILRERRRFCATYVFSSGEEGVLTGKRARKVWDHMRMQNHPGNVSELHGIPASSGIYRGRVRKVETPSKEGKLLKKGEVLVTYMTRPDFIPLMHKAGALVTDEGGLTSHAAIISRELGIPCIVGTRFAMRVLKNGEKVEVDGRQGVVRKI